MGKTELSNTTIIPVVDTTSVVNKSLNNTTTSDKQYRFILQQQYLVF